MNLRTSALDSDREVSAGVCKLLLVRAGEAFRRIGTSSRTNHLSEARRFPSTPGPNRRTRTSCCAEASAPRPPWCRPGNSHLSTGVRYFGIYDLRSTSATRLSAGGVADEWVTQLLRQGDAKVLKKYSQMKREALEKLNRDTNDAGRVLAQ